MLTLSAVVITALLLDRLLGEPRRWHPLVGFGRGAAALEHAMNRGALRRLRGVVACVLVLLAVLALGLMLSIGLQLLPTPLAVFGTALVVYLCVGWRSLREHAHAVAQALTGNELALARERVSMLVSRDTDSLDAAGVARAATESVLENGSDAVLAPLCWFVIAGLPGVLVYRAANTLDAMWGYRNARYLEFGWAAARIDDLLNLVPSRLLALSYALCGHTTSALACWRSQAGLCESPNAGPVMAAGAGALGYQLGGPGWYHGALKHKPVLGIGRLADATAVDAALTLLSRALGLLVLLLVVLEYVYAGLG